MKVILLQDVNTLGKKGDVKEVAPGYGKNYLIPKQLARYATEDAVKSIEAHKQALIRKEEENLENTASLAKALEGKKITIKVKAGEKDQLFESINGAKIINTLAKQGVNPDKANAELEEPIKKTGDYPVLINLGHNIKTKIIVTVEATKENKPAKETKQKTETKEVKKTKKVVAK